MDPKVLQKIFTVSTAKCWATDGTNPVPGVIPTAPSSNDYNGGFAVTLLKKDLKLGLECAEAAGVDAEFTRKSIEYQHELEQAGHAEKDFGFVYQYVKARKDLTKL